jgi:hypothetical protein
MLMVASKGGVSFEKALKMTRREAKELGFALAIAHGGEVNWEDGTVSPPKFVTESINL